MLYFNGTKVERLIYNGTEVTRALYNGTEVYTVAPDEEFFTPSWTLSGEGWTNTTWGEWSVGRDEGVRLVGIAEATKNIGNHTKLRFTPAGYGWRTAATNGDIRIYINGDLKYSQGAGVETTEPVEIDLTGYSGTVTIRVELQAEWSYTDLYTETQLMLHN